LFAYVLVSRTQRALISIAHNETSSKGRSEPHWTLYAQKQPYEVLGTILKIHPQLSAEASLSLDNEAATAALLLNAHARSASQGQLQRLPLTPPCSSANQQGSLHIYRMATQQQQHGQQQQRRRTRSTTGASAALAGADGSSTPPHPNQPFTLLLDAAARAHIEDQTACAVRQMRGVEEVGGSAGGCRHLQHSEDDEEHDVSPVNLVRRSSQQQALITYHLQLGSAAALLPPQAPQAQAAAASAAPPQPAAVSMATRRLTDLVERSLTDLAFDATFNFLG